LFKKECHQRGCSKGEKAVLKKVRGEPKGQQRRTGKKSPPSGKGETPPGPSKRKKNLGVYRR